MCNVVRNDIRAVGGLGSEFLNRTEVVNLFRGFKAFPSNIRDPYRLECGYLIIIGLIVGIQILEQFYLSPNIQSSKINDNYKTESRFNILSPS